MVRIGFFSSDDFDSKYGNPGNQLDTERNWFENNVWDEINDTANTSTHPGVGINISATTLEQRVRAADDFLRRSFPDYGQMDAAIVMDAFGSNAYAGFAHETCGAGGWMDKTAIIDVDSSVAGDQDYESDLSKPYRHFIGHEVGHLFCAVHDDRAVLTSDEVTYMLDTSSTGYCYNYGNTDYNSKQFSYCAESEINNKVNNI